MAMLAECATRGCSTLVFGGGLCVECEQARAAALRQELRQAILRKVEPRRSEIGVERISTYFAHAAH